MIEIRHADDRGQAHHDWLDSRFSFSFAEYWDPAHLQFGPLRVINDDWIAPASGFGMHGHKDMEIISYVLEGELTHRDSMGNGSVIKPGDVQRMSAGTGVLHSEANPSKENKTHLLQIWITPNQAGVKPGYEEKRFSAEEKRGRLRLVASPDGADGSVRIHQDARMYAGLFDNAETATLKVARDRLVYLHVARGKLVANNLTLDEGDALKLSDAELLELSAGEGAEVLVFDLPTINH